MSSIEAPRGRAAFAANAFLAAAIISSLAVAEAAPRIAGGPPSDPDAPTVDSVEECGLVLTPFEARAYLERRENAPPHSTTGTPGPPYYIAIAAHIVRQSNGTGGLPVTQYEQAVLDATLAYANVGIVFYTIGAIDFIDSDAFYFNIDTYSEIDALRTTNPVPDAINCYFTPNLKVNSSTPICGISAFTFSDVQAIAMSNSCTATSTNHSTFPHEIGHYFDLFHTHEPAFGDEYVDGSNCEGAGDLLCDTPADPTLSSATVDAGTCAYTGEETDSHGEYYEPDTRQYLSYSLKHCRDRFSPESETKIVQTLLAERANLISPVVGIGLADEATPMRAFVELATPRPNPTSGGAELVFTLRERAFVELSIYDVRGAAVRTIARGIRAAGLHELRWDGADDAGHATAPGLYFARVSAGGVSAFRKIHVVK